MGNQASVKGDDPTFKAGEEPKPELTFTEEELKAKLTEEEYRVTQEKGNDMCPDTLKLWKSTTCMTFDMQ